METGHESGFAVYHGVKCRRDYFTRVLEGESASLDVSSFDDSRLRRGSGPPLSSFQLMQTHFHPGCGGEPLAVSDNDVYSIQNSDGGYLARPVAGIGVIEGEYARAMLDTQAVWLRTVVDEEESGKIHDVRHRLMLYLSLHLHMYEGARVRQDETESKFHCEGAFVCIELLKGRTLLHRITSDDRKESLINSERMAFSLKKAVASVGNIQDALRCEADTKGVAISCYYLDDPDQLIERQSVVLIIDAEGAEVMVASDGAHRMGQFRWHESRLDRLQRAVGRGGGHGQEVLQRLVGLDAMELANDPQLLVCSTPRFVRWLDFLIRFA